MATSSPLQLFFDPDSYPNDTLKQFIAFSKRFELRYKAQYPHPPKAIMDSVMERWKIINVDKVPTIDDYDKEKLAVIASDMVAKFLGVHSSERLYDDWVSAENDASKRDSATWEEFKTAMQEFYKPTENLTLKNYQFRSLKQGAEEPFVSFVNRVERESKQCNFKCQHADCTAENIATRDQIIIGTINDKIREEALKKSLDLSNLRKEGMHIESSTRGIAELSGEISVNKVGKYSKRNKSKQSQPKKCYFCGSEFPDHSSVIAHARQCKAKASTCSSCNRVGHLEKACKYKAVRPLDEMADGNESGSQCSETNEAYSINVFKVSVEENTKTRKWTSCDTDFKAQVIINNKLEEVLADTGAKVSVCGMKEAERYGLVERMFDSTHKIKPYNSAPIPVEGLARCSVTFGASSIPVEWYIINGSCQPILSGNISRQLGIIEFNRNAQPLQPVMMIDSKCCEKEEIQTIITKYSENFSGLGKLKNYQVKLHVNKEVKPKTDPPRTVPYHLRERADKIIAEMCSNDIIEEHPTTEPAPWISNCVLEPKPDKSLRMTLDARNINKAIESSNLPIPKAEDIKAKLAGAKIFSKMDFKSAYWQIELHPDSRYVTVFRSNDKLYRYKRLLMGVAPAQGELNTALKPLFAHIDDAHLIHDDLIIGSDDIHKHNEALRQVMEAIHKAGITLNPEKCKFGADSIKFWGLIISDKGIQPDPEKVEALKHMSKPQNKEELVSFICMMQSNSEFMPNFAKLSSPLRELTKAKARYTWGKTQQDCFTKLIDEFKQSSLLQYFDMNKKTFIFTDAHVSGLGAMLAQGTSVQDARPITVASRTTSKAERRYPQIDLEATAIDFALRRFRQYVAGAPNDVEVITDHEPLKSIFNGTKKGSVRSERVKLRHQDLRYIVKYQKGKINQADYLSRHAKPIETLSREEQDEADDLNNLLYTLHTTPIMDVISLARISEETKRNPVLVKLMNLVKNGEPISDHCDEHALKKFRKVFSELTVTGNDIILKGERIVLPKTLQDEVIELAHRGAHPGQSGLVRRIRSHFFFHDMDKMVTKFVETCKHCQMFTDKKTKEPIEAHKIPNDNWSTVSVDLFGPMPSGRHIVVVQDLKSRYPTAKLVSSTSAEKVIPALQETYSYYGYPERQISDNGPPFNSFRMRDFAEKHNMKLQLNPPYHPSSNPVESFMRPVGKAMKIGRQLKHSEKDTLDEVLDHYRQTPHPITKISPSAMIFRDGMATKFPRQKASLEQIQRANEADRMHKENNQANQNNSKYRICSEFQIGDQVWVRNFERQKKFDPLFLEQPFVITGIDTKSHSVEVAGDGRMFRRHLDDIKPFDESTSNGPQVGRDSRYSEWYDEQEGDERPTPGPTHTAGKTPPETETYEHPAQDTPIDHGIPNGAGNGVQLRRGSRSSRNPNPRYSEKYTYMLTISNATGGVEIRPFTPTLDSE